MNLHHDLLTDFVVEFRKVIPVSKLLVFCNVVDMKMPRAVNPHHVASAPQTAF